MTSPRTTTVGSRMSDEEALLVRLAQSIDRSGLDATSTLELVASWVENEFEPGDFSDAASARFRKTLMGHGVNVEKLSLVIADPARFPHRNEVQPRRDSAIAEQMQRVRETVGRLLAGEASSRGGDQTRNTGLQGTSSDTATAIVRRLNRDRPDLAARVAAREISANAAAIEAGYRRRKVSVPVDDPSSIARSLRRYLTAEQLAELRTLLDES